jgi:hypothetical protein
MQVDVMNCLASSGESVLKMVRTQKRLWRPARNLGVCRRTSFAVLAFLPVPDSPASLKVNIRPCTVMLLLRVPLGMSRGPRWELERSGSVMDGRMSPG